MSGIRVPRLAVLMFLLLTQGAFAATFVVDQLTDDNGACTPGACSLREATIAANNLPGPDVILLGPGVHELTIPGINEVDSMTGDLNLKEPVEIRGSTLGPTIIDANGLDRIIEIFPFFDFTNTYSLSDLTLRGGFHQGEGGGVYATACHLRIHRTVFEDNHGQTGGALFFANVEAVIEGSTFRGNTATGGGGALVRITQIVNFGVLLENSTISGNSAGFVGGGLVSFGDGVLTLRNTTVAGNTARFGTALFLDHVPRVGLVFESSILGGNCAWASSDFPPTSLGGNLQGPDDSCFLTHPSDQSNVADLGLGPLELSDNGYSHSLLPGSPAIDAAAECPERDQRGAPRPQDGDGDGVAFCDAGAFEAGTPNGLADVPVLAPAGLIAFASLLAAAARRRLRPRS